MKGKLIKENNRYTLFVDGKVFGDTEGHPLKSITNRLSIKNCQAIERGYDLDNYIAFELQAYIAEKHNQDKCTGFMDGYEIGFQKALEILGDKKYSEEDMKSFARNYYREIRENTSNLLWDDLADKCMKEHIQSLQQTEWDVEIEMVKEHIGSGCYKKYPKSDDEGCLILKKYKNG